MSTSNRRCQYGHERQAEPVQGQPGWYQDRCLANGCRSEPSLAYQPGEPMTSQEQTEFAARSELSGYARLADFAAAAVVADKKRTKRRRK